MVVQVLAGYWDFNLETRDLLLCPRSRRMFGFAGALPKKLASRAWEPRIHPQDMPIIKNEFENALLRNDIYAARFRTLRPDGTTCQVLGIGRPTTANAKRFVGLNFDLSDAAATAVRESRSVGRLAMGLASGLFLGIRPANENDWRPWRAWSPVRTRATRISRSNESSERQILLGRAQATFERRQLRKRFLNPAMFGEPAFDLLLALYITTSSGMLPVRVIGILADVSTSVSLRWLKFLVKEGLVLTVEGSGEDPGSSIVALTDKGRIVLDEYFKASDSPP
jgi:hypothetical protein